jgi:hypothetical protein
MFAVACCAILLVTLPHEVRGDSKGTDEPISAANFPSKDMFKSIPGNHFIENAGQLSNHDVRFYTTSGDMQIGFAESAVLIKMVERPPAPVAKSLPDWELMRSPPPEPEPSRGVLLRLNFEGSNMVTPQGRDPLPHPTNFFIGNDPGRWRTNVRSFRAIIYEGLYAGVDLVYRATDKGVKYDFILGPGADPGVITMSYEGTNHIDLDRTGNLLVRTPVKDVADSAPIAYQDGDVVSCPFVSRAAMSIGFECRDVDKTRSLVIDPLFYSTYLGGGDYDEGRSIVIDTDGNAYVVGDAWSTDFPVTPGAFDATLNGTFDAFVAKLDSTGISLLYSTYLGGGGDDEGHSIVIDSASNVYITGDTTSADFPVTLNAFDRTHNGFDDAFAAKLDFTSGSLLYSTYLGGTNYDAGVSVTVDSAGNAYITGWTWSPDFPVTPGALDVTFDGGADAFVAKLNSTGSSLLYSTYLGGSRGDGGSSIAVDTEGNASVAGYTDSTDFPVTPGAIDKTHNGLEDAFVAKLNFTGGSLLYSTYLGGSDNDLGWSLATDSAGNTYVTGVTSSTDFPVTPGAFDGTLSGSEDAFVAKLDSTFSSLLYSTYLGGSDWEMGDSITTDSAGNAYIAGDTGSADFPVTSDAFDTTSNGAGDIFIAKISHSDDSLLYSTYLGGGGMDKWPSIAVDSARNVHVIGSTNSTDFPVTPSAFDTTYNGGMDAFVARLDLVAPNSPPNVSNPGVQGFTAAPNILHVTDTTPDLNWTYSDPDGDPQIRNDLRVGTAPGTADMWDPPATLGLATTVTYTGSPLIRGNDYYFAVKVSDGMNWSAEVEVTFHMNSIPNAPTIPIAPGHSSVVSTNPSQDVSWTTGGDAEGDTTTYEWEVSTDTSFTNVVAQGTTTSTTSTSFTTIPSTTYFWRVRARDDYEPVTWSAYGSTPPGYWTFSTSPPPNTPPTIAITSPSGGEVWTRGISQTVTWTASDNEDASIALVVWINYTSGAGSGSICGPIAGSAGSCVWTLPAIIATDAVVNSTVIDTGGLKGYDESGQFTIQAPPNTPPTVTITSPTGGEEFLKGSSHTITWTMQDDQDINANLTIYINYTMGGVTSQIVAALKGQVFFAWTLPNIEANDVVVNITVIDSGGLKGWSQSGPFTIKAPSSPPPDFLSQYWWLLVVIVAVVIVLLLLALMKRRKPREEKEEVPPSEQQNPPPSE